MLGYPVFKDDNLLLRILPELRSDGSTIKPTVTISFSGTCRQGFGETRLTTSIFELGSSREASRIFADTAP
jgi:hypothetical protein